jgi:hypothetical protein
LQNKQNLAHFGGHVGLIFGALVWVFLGISSGYFIGISLSLGGEKIKGSRRWIKDGKYRRKDGENTRIIKTISPTSLPIP